MTEEMQNSNNTACKFPNDTILYSPSILSRTISFDEVSWKKIIVILSKKFFLKKSELERYSSRLYLNIIEPFCFRWILNPSLSEIENLFLNALLEINGCDEVKINRSVNLLASKIAYSHQLTFLRSFKLLRLENQKDKNNPSTVSKIYFKNVSIELKVKERKFVLSSKKNIILLYLLVFSTAILFIVPVLFLLIYCFAVFSQFARDPHKITMIATKDIKIGLALLSFLTGLSALFGVVFRRILR